MGFLNFLSKNSAADPIPLPMGSFTVNAAGAIISSTLPHSFPKNSILEIGQAILLTFREAQRAQLEVPELNLEFGMAKITARELGGGAIVFISQAKV